MATRRIDRELRLTTAIEGLGRFRSRSFRIPEAVTERQRKDRRFGRSVNSTLAAPLLATVDAIGSGAGVASANAAATGSSSGGYYGGGGGGDIIKWSDL